MGSRIELGKDPCDFLEAELNGFKGDRHALHARGCWVGDKQPEGTVRRNERQWSAVSVEELEEIQNAMDLSEPLTAASLGANLCLSGVPHLSRLPKGTVFKFPSGAELIVEEFNPPCKEMGEKLASIHTTNSGEPLKASAFSKASKYLRGVVGVVEVAGVIKQGDDVEVKIYEPPKWIAKISNNET